MKIKVIAKHGVFAGRQVRNEMKGTILEVGRDIREDMGQLLVKLGKAEVIEEAVQEVKQVARRVTRKKKAVKGKENAERELPQDGGNERADGGGDSVPSPRRETVLSEVPDKSVADLI